MTSKLLGKILILAAWISAALLLFFLWNNGAFLPRWIRWENSAQSDLSGQYGIVLSKKSVEVSYEERVIWTSPDGVKVQKTLACDVDNDGQDELVLLCWKKGRYGTIRPIWVEKDEQKWSQHIFVYELTPGRVKPKWMSSYIGQDVMNLDSNQQPAPYCRILLTNLDGEISIWAWDSWGFTKEENKSY